MRRASAVVVVLCVAAAAVAAGACGRKREYPPPERHLPADGPVSVVVPALGAAARQAGALYRTVAPAPPAAPMVEAYAAVKAQLGFDPFDVRGLEQAGLDPAGAAAASLGAGRPPLLVLPMVDLSRFDATASRLARDRMGATERITTKSQGLDLVIFRRPGSGSASLAYVALGPHALLSPGPQGPETVVAAARAPEESSLLRSPIWSRARAALGEGFLVTVLAPPGSTALADLRFVRDGAALGIRASATQLGLRLAALLSPEREEWWKAMGPPGTPAAAPPELAGRLPPEAALLLRWAGDPTAAARQLDPWMPAGLRSALAGAQVDLAGAIAPALGPGGVASLSLAPTFTVAEFSSPRFDPRRTDPFELVLLDAVVPVRDPAPLRALLARLQKAGPRLALKVVPRGGADASAWTVSWGKARLGVALAGDRLLVAGNADRLPALEARAAAGGGWAGGTAPARGALASGLAGAVLDVEHLAASVEALPESAYGTGPNAVVMRSLVNRYLEPAHALASLSLRLGLAPGAALLDLDVEGRSTPPPKP
jgi:hypothetical protein